MILFLIFVVLYVITMGVIIYLQHSYYKEKNIDYTIDDTMHQMHYLCFVPVINTVILIMALFKKDNK